MWLDDYNNSPVGLMTFDNAILACEALIFAGYADWRLPNILEWLSIYGWASIIAPYIDTNIFLNMAVNSYHSSTTNPVNALQNFCIDLTNINAPTVPVAKPTGSLCFPVRGGQP